MRAGQLGIRDIIRNWTRAVGLQTYKPWCSATLIEKPMEQWLLALIAFDRAKGGLVIETSGGVFTDPVEARGAADFFAVSNGCQPPAIKVKMLDGREYDCPPDAFPPSPSALADQFVFAPPLSRGKAMAEPKAKRVLVRKSLGELSDLIAGVASDCIEGEYPTEFQTYDGAWEELFKSLVYLRNKLGETRYIQLVEMMTQAKCHFESGYAQSAKGPIGVSGVICSGRIDVGERGQVEIVLGSRLMQDAGQIVHGKAPFAYPKRLYRWARPPESVDPSYKPLSPIHGQLLDQLNTLLEDEHEWPGKDLTFRRNDFRASIGALSDPVDKVLSLQLLDMMSQAERHYREAKPGLANGLLMDIRRVLCGLSVPFSYGGKWCWPKSDVR